MTPQARILLELGDGPADPETVRRAYLRRVRVVRLDADPDGFTRLRDAFESLIAGAAAPAAEVTATRDALAAQPDSAETRWKLLSYFPYAAGPEALPILCHGAERQPDEFLDELLFHFPGKVPAGILAAARNGAAFGRLLLIADVHATQGRPADAFEVLRAALTAGDLHSPALQKLAMRPVFSLHAHLQIDAAGEALALVKQRMGRLALDAQTVDPETSTILHVADELARLGASFPLDLRQVVAAAAKRGDFSNAAYEARFATRLMKPREVRKLSKQLAQDAPTLTKILGLDLTEDQLRPEGTPRFRIPLGWGTIIVTLVLYLSWFIHKMRPTYSISEIEETGRAALIELLTKKVQQDCADPNSEACHKWDDEATREAGNRDAATVLDGGPVLPMIGKLHIGNRSRQGTHEGGR